MTFAQNVSVWTQIAENPLLPFKPKSSFRTFACPARQLDFLLLVKVIYGKTS